MIQDCPEGFRRDELGDCVVSEGAGAAPETIELATAAVRYTGERDGDGGGVVAGGGDFDADGYDDFLVGASGNDEGGDDAGVAYLVLGSGSPVGVQPAAASLSTATEFRGDELDYVGSYLSASGDVDGDGWTDLLVGATGYVDGNAGAVYLLLGFGADG